MRFQRAADQLRGRGLGVHGIHRDQQPRLTECAEKLSHAGYFVALLGDGELAEHQPRAVGEDRDNSPLLDVYGSDGQDQYLLLPAATVQ